MRLQPTPKLRAYFNDYREFHRTSGNAICHFIGIPLIMLTLFALLGERGSVVLFVLGIAWYFTLDWKITIPFSVFAFGLLLLSTQMGSLWAWFGFTVGWIFQSIGHGIYEKKSPAFLKNILHVLIGPLWVFSKWTHYEI